TPWQRMPGTAAERAADVRALLAVMWAHPGKKLLFMGQEYGQESEWSDVFGPDWSQLSDPLHRGVRDLVARLNGLYRALPALWCDDDPGGLTRVRAGIGAAVPDTDGPPAPLHAFARRC